MSVSFAVFSWLSVVIVLCIAMTCIAVAFVHAFMENLSFFPGVLTTGGAGQDQGYGGECSKGGLFHEGVKERSTKLEALSLCAMVFSCERAELRRDFMKMHPPFTRH
jgi:hypothetical protein